MFSFVLSFFMVILYRKRLQKSILFSHFFIFFREFDGGKGEKPMKDYLTLFLIRLSHSPLFLLQ